MQTRREAPPPGLGDAFGCGGGCQEAEEKASPPRESESEAVELEAGK
jgi:hypothetical protein